MFFDDVSFIETIAGENNTSVFVVPDNIDVMIKNALVLKPESKSVITIEQVRDVLIKLNTKQVHDQYIVIRPADKLSLEASNAILKSLEEPGDKVHFVLVTNSISMLIPTILSRAHIYVLREKFDLKKISCDDEKNKDLAKKLIAAKPRELFELVNEITSKKENVRNRVLNILSISIEMLYKTYLLTGKDVFLKKLSKFNVTYDNIAKNGNIKLHLIADLC